MEDHNTIYYIEEKDAPSQSIVKIVVETPSLLQRCVGTSFLCASILIPDLLG